MSGVRCSSRSLRLGFLTGFWNLGTITHAEDELICPGDVSFSGSHPVSGRAWVPSPDVIPELSLCPAFLGVPLTPTSVTGGVFQSS